MEEKNMRSKKIILYIILTLALTACAVRQLVRPSGKLIQLGITTERQVYETMGSPAKTKWEERQGMKIKTLIYNDGKRIAYFDFADGVLVRYRYDGYCPAPLFFRSGECLDYHDIEKVKTIVANKSTLKDVEATLGNPSGESKYPFIDNPDGRRLTYVYIGGPLLYTEVYFEIDKENIVRKIEVVSLKKK
jgi:hypothetical protein